LDLCIDDAIRVGFDTYKALGYSIQPRYTFRYAASEFHEHLQSTNQGYSVERARQWIESHKSEWEHEKAVS